MARCRIISEVTAPSRIDAARARAAQGCRSLWAKISDVTAQARVRASVHPWRDWRSVLISEVTRIDARARARARTSLSSCFGALTARLHALSTAADAASCSLGLDSEVTAPPRIDAARARWHRPRVPLPARLRAVKGCRSFSATISEVTARPALCVTLRRDGAVADRRRRPPARVCACFLAPAHCITCVHLHLLINELHVHVHVLAVLWTGGLQHSARS